MQEEWKIIDVDPRYEVSNLGRIRRNEEILKNVITKRKEGDLNYPFVYVGKQKRSVHILVLNAFVGPCPKGKEANHKNGIKSDSKLENLEWVTHSENIKHAYNNGLIRDKHILSEIQREEVRRLYLSGDHTTNSLKQLFQVHKVTIVAALKEKNIPLMKNVLIPPNTKKKIKEEYIPYKVSCRYLAEKYGVSRVTVETIIKE